MSDLLRKGAFSLMVVFALLAVPFTLIELTEDSGWWLAVLLGALVLVPLVFLSYLAGVRPRTTSRWLGIGVGVLAVYVVAEALVPGDPVRSLVAISTIVLAVPLAVLGLSETRDAGTMLVVDGMLPIVSMVLLTVQRLDQGEEPHRNVSAVGAGMPVFIVGALFLLAWALRPRPL